MNDLNDLKLTGRLTKAAEMVNLSSGTPLVKLSVAVNRAYQQNSEWKEQVSYFDVDYFGDSAKRNFAEFEKGRQVLVEASVRQDRWEKDGKVCYAIKIIANRVMPLCRPGEGKRVGSQNSQSQPQYNSASNAEPEYPPDWDETEPPANF